jgi:hypothetical protein
MSVNSGIKALAGGARARTSSRSRVLPASIERFAAPLDSTSKPGVQQYVVVRDLTPPQK